MVKSVEIRNRWHCPVWAVVSKYHSSQQQMTNGHHQVHHNWRLAIKYFLETCLFIMMTSWNRNIFHVIGPLCGEFTGHRWIPLIKGSDSELWYFLWSAPEINALSKQSWGWWFETPLCSFWRHCNGTWLITLLAMKLDDPRITMCSCQLE